MFEAFLPLVSYCNEWNEVDVKSGKSKGFMGLIVHHDGDNKVDS